MRISTPVVRRPQDIPEDKNRRSKKQLFCPYCIEYRRFKGQMRKHADGSQTVSYKRCTGCGISDQDYYVKHVNKLWGMSLKPTGKSQGKKA